VGRIATALNDGQLRRNVGNLVRPAESFKVVGPAENGNSARWKDQSGVGIDLNFELLRLEVCPAPIETPIGHKPDQPLESVLGFTLRATFSFYRIADPGEVETPSSDKSLRTSATAHRRQGDHFAEAAEICERNGKTAETWQARLEKLSEGRLMGRFPDGIGTFRLAATPGAPGLREVA
jgi:hypothetical protein